jgi:aspartate kinase
MKGVNFRESSLASDTLVKTNLKNTTKPAVSGTIMTNTHNNKNEPVVEISSENNFCSIYISKYRMNKEVGFGRKLLRILEDFQLYYRHMPSGVDALNLVLHENQLNQIIESELIQRIRTELSADKVTIERNLALIMLIGGKMHHNADTIARAARVLAEKRINIEMIHMNQGSSQISLVFSVKAHDEKRAVSAIHNEFFESVSI